MMHRLLFAFFCFILALPSIAQDNAKGKKTTDTLKVRKPIETNASDEGKVFSVVEQIPEFPGGSQGMLQFIREQVKREPDSDVSGTVYVTFVVTAEGKAINPKILKGIKGAPYYDQAVIRMVNQMPVWKPGKLNGRAVAVQFNLPVRIELR
ncbi:MAG TPA: energy transducer TonB [Bacteroidia bacterium]|jgi:protein TonB|nr:energy transducer TonB [Bacteroidia bacterium]